MAYRLTVDSGPNIGLHAWLTGMAGVVVDIDETETSTTIQGRIVRTDVPGTPNAQVMLQPVNLHGDALPDASYIYVKIENITEVAVW